jgi:hypothetical protein
MGLVQQLHDIVPGTEPAVFGTGIKAAAEKRYRSAQGGRDACPAGNPAGFPGVGRVNSACIHCNHCHLRFLLSGCDFNLLLDPVL